MKIGDHVRVIAAVWDDHALCTLEGKEGIVADLDNPVSGPYRVFVEFGTRRPDMDIPWDYDFRDDELEILK